MNILKIKKISNEIKNYLNNIDALGVYIDFWKRHKKISIHLQLDKFLKLFKNDAKKMYLYNPESGNTQIKYIRYINFNNNDFELRVKCGNITYFAFIDSKEKFNEMKFYLIHKTNLYKY